MWRKSEQLSEHRSIILLLWITKKKGTGMAKMSGSTWEVVRLGAGERFSKILGSEVYNFKAHLLRHAHPKGRLVGAICFLGLAYKNQEKLSPV